MKLLYKLLAFIGIHIEPKNNTTFLNQKVDEETGLESRPYLYGDDQRIIEEYADEEIIGMCGWYNAETGESEITGNLMSRTVKFVDSDGTTHIDTRWYPENAK